MTLKPFAPTFLFYQGKCTVKPLVYFDNGASAQKSRRWLLTLSLRLIQTNMPTCTGDCISFPISRQTNLKRRAKPCGRFLNAPSVDDVIFTRSSTEAINLVAHSYGGMVLKEGDEVIISILEHHSTLCRGIFCANSAVLLSSGLPVDEDGNSLWKSSRSF